MKGQDPLWGSHNIAGKNSLVSTLGMVIVYLPWAGTVTSEIGFRFTFSILLFRGPLLGLLALTPCQFPRPYVQPTPVPFFVLASLV